MSEDYEKVISLSRITEQAERHEETIKYMEKIIEQKKGRFNHRRKKYFILRI